MAEPELPIDDLLRLYYWLHVTRALDDRAQDLQRAGCLPGHVTSGRGQEATAVGAAYALAVGDVLAPVDRDLGALLVRGMTPREIMAHWLQRDAPLARGRESHLHLGDMRDRLIIPATGVLGTTVPVAAGVALASRLRSERRVALAFIGDGAAVSGDVHEALTLAAALDLALVLIIENNGYALSMPATNHTRARHLADRASGYGIPGAIVDGNDVIAVLEVTARAVEAARAGRGPSLIEAQTFHVPRDDGDAPDYIARETLYYWRRQDPLDRYARYLRLIGILDDAKAQDYQAEIAGLIDDAVEYAAALPMPDPALPVELYAPEDAPTMGPPLLGVGAMTRERAALEA